MAPSLPSAAERERMLAKIEPLSIHLVPTGALGALARASRAFPLAAGVALYEAGSERNTELYFVASGSLHVLRASPAGASGPRARYWRRVANGVEAREESLEEVATVGRGAVVGGSAFFARKPHHVTVVAVTRSVIVSLSRSDLLTHAPPEALVALADHARRTVHADLEVARRSLPPHPGLSTPIRGSTAAQRYEGGGKPGHGSAPGASDGRGTAAEKDSAHSEIARLLAQSAARIAIGTPAGASSGRGSRPFAARRPRAGKRGGALPAAHGPPAAGHGPTSAALDRARRVPRWALPAPEDAPSSSAASDPRTRTSHAQAKAATVSPVAPGLDVTAAAASRAHTFTRAMQWQRSVDRDAKEGAALLERNAAPDGASPPNAGRSSPVAARWSTDGAPSPEEYHKAPPARTVSRMAVSGRMLDGGAAHAPTRVTLSAKDLPPVPAGQPRGAALTASVTKISSMRGSQPALLLHLRPQPGRCAPREWWSSLPLDSFPAADGGGEAVDAAIRERRQLAGAALREATRCITSLWRNTCGGVALHSMPAASFRDVAVRSRSIVFECIEERAGPCFALGEENVAAASQDATAYCGGPQGRQAALEALLADVVAMWTAVCTVSEATAAIEALCTSLEGEGGGAGAAEHPPFSRWVCIHPWAISVRGAPPVSRLVGASHNRHLHTSRAAASAAPPVADGLAVRHLVAFPPAQRPGAEPRGLSAARRRARGKERSPPRWRRPHGGSPLSASASAPVLPAGARGETGAVEAMRAADDGDDYDPSDNVESDKEYPSVWGAASRRVVAPIAAASSGSRPVPLRAPRGQRAVAPPAASAAVGGSGQPAWWLEGLRAASPPHAPSDGQRSPAHATAHAMGPNEGGRAMLSGAGVAGRATSPSIALAGLAPWQTADDGEQVEFRAHANSVPARSIGGPAQPRLSPAATRVPLSPMQAQRGAGADARPRSGSVAVRERSVRPSAGPDQRRSPGSGVEEAEMVRRHLMQRGNVPRRSPADRSPADGDSPRRRPPSKGLTVSLPALETTAALWGMAEPDAQQ